jgi:hypothetical protein
MLGTSIVGINSRSKNHIQHCHPCAPTMTLWYILQKSHPGVSQEIHRNVCVDSNPSGWIGKEKCVSPRNLIAAAGHDANCGYVYKPKKDLNKIVSLIHK